MPPPGTWTRVSVLPRAICETWCATGVCCDGSGLGVGASAVVLPPSARPRLVALQMVSHARQRIVACHVHGTVCAEFCHGHGTTWLPVMGPPGVSCRAVLAGAAAQRASVLIAGPLGLAICRRFCAWASSRSLPGWPAMAGAGPDVRADCPPAVSRTGRGPRKGLMGAKGDGGKHDSGTAGPDDVVGGGRGWTRRGCRRWSTPL